MSKYKLQVFLYATMFIAISCKKDKLTPEILIQIESPSASISSLSAADLPLAIKATASSNVDLKEYTITIKSTADNKELFSKTKNITGKDLSISEEWDYYVESNLPMELEVTVKEVSGKTFAEKRTFTRSGLSGFDKNLGLGVSMIHYKDIPVSNVDKIETEFIITNYGSKSYKKDDLLYINSRLNNNYFDLRLFPGNTTTLKLNKDLNKGDTLKYNPGYIFGSQTLTFPFPGFQGASQLEVCIVVWGTTPESVQQNNPSATKCISCGTYKP